MKIRTAKELKELKRMMSRFTGRRLKYYEDQNSKRTQRTQ